MLERAGIQRADLVIAVTGDDEDNMLVCQVAKEKYLCDRDHRARQQPAQPRPLQAARDPAGRLRDRPDPAPDRARGARATASCTCSRWKRSAWRSSSSRSQHDAPTVGEKVADIELPEGSLIISVLRGGTGFVPKADTVIEAGDEVLLVLDPGLEEAITAYFAPNGHPASL